MPRECSLLAHAADIDDLLEGLDGVLEDGLDGLHDTEAALHVVDLGLHALDGLHLAGDLDEGLSVIESLEDAGGKGLLDVLDGGGLGDSGGLIVLSLGSEGGVKGALKVRDELGFGHGLELLHGVLTNELGVVVMVVSGSSGGDESEDGKLHLLNCLIIIKLNLTN